MIGTTRRHLTALSVASAVVALAACAPSSSSAGGSGSGGGSGKGVTLSVWSWRTEDVAAYNAIFDVYEKAHPGTTVDFKAFKNTEYNQILTTGLAGSSGPDVVQVRSYGQLQPTIASKSLVAARRHGRPEQLGRQRRQERQGQGGRQALRRPARPADAPDVLQQGPVRQAGPEAADHVGAVHRGQRQAEGERHHADGRRRQGLLDAADRAPGAGRAALRRRGVREGRDERPEDVHGPRLGRLRGPGRTS